MLKVSPKALLESNTTATSFGEPILHIFLSLKGRTTGRWFIPPTKGLQFPFPKFSIGILMRGHSL